MKSILHKGISEMKRLPPFLMLVLLLCGCSSGTKIEANESTFLIGLRNNCDCETYKVRYEYYIGDRSIGGGYACNADGSALSFDDVLIKDFIRADFPEGDNLAEFRIEVFVVDGAGVAYPCGEPLSLNAAFGNVYEIIITGNYGNGFCAAWRENEREERIWNWKNTVRIGVKTI